MIRGPQGQPIVGPSGELLDRALLAAGIVWGVRTQVYVTNAVKHFKWTQRGKRRLHRTPNQTEIQACRPWLESELEPGAVAAKAVLGLLGAVAAKAVLGPEFRGTRSRAGCWPPRSAPGGGGG
ncbi:MAG: hypothetical protein M3083_21065, partial [Actinomycetota bacterium]|nr:hypothetical protein [Actinomycetota bacterium]